METFAILLTYIGVALILAKVLAQILERVRIPGVLGEIMVGALLSVYVLAIPLPEMASIMRDPSFQWPLDAMAHLGIILLLFLAGLEISPKELRTTGKTAIVSTSLGVIFPLVLGYFVSLELGYSSRESLVIGILLTATSIGVTVRTLMEIGKLNTDVGVCSLSASVMDDVIGIFLIIFVAGAMSLILLTVDLIVFLLVVILFARFLINPFMMFAERIHLEKGTLAITIGFLLILSGLAQFTLLAAVEGAFFAGVLVNLTPQSRAIFRDIKIIGYSFFIPLFFVYVGTHINPSAFTELPVITTAGVILITAIVGKVAGRGIGSYITGFSARESLQMGIGSIPRMEIALISLFIAIKSGAVQSEHVHILVASTVIFVTVTTLITPPLLKISFGRGIR